MACVREAGWVCGEKIERTVCVPGRLVVVFSACYQGWRGERGWAAIMRSFVFPCSGEGGSTLGSLGLGFSVYTTGWVGGAGPRDPFTAGGGTVPVHAGHLEARGHDGVTGCRWGAQRPNLP